MVRDPRSAHLRRPAILVTGSAGLIGTALCDRLRLDGFRVVGLDLRAAQASERGDVLDRELVRRAVAQVAGIVHLAALSRVIWAERDPQLCERVNLGGLDVVLSAARERANKPWVLFASSREVYGNAESLPVSEQAPLLPVNIYGRTKVEGERMVASSGLLSAIVRLSNVYGRPDDHADRVIPAFVRAARQGASLRLDGAESTFDFTWLDDVVEGLVTCIERLEVTGTAIAPIHLVSGRGTTLAELARVVCEATQSSSAIEVAPSRTFDVGRFVGDPRGAYERIGWKARTRLEDGISALCAAMAGAGGRV